MAISFLLFLRHRFTPDPPQCLTAAKWTVLLTLTAAVASFAPEFIFVNATSLSSSFSKSCRRDGYIRIPLDFPGHVVCLPAKMVNRSSLDFFVPTVFAALGVGVSACFVRSLGLWENSRTSRFDRSWWKWIDHNLQVHRGFRICVILFRNYYYFICDAKSAMFNRSLGLFGFAGWNLHGPWENIQWASKWTSPTCWALVRVRGTKK